MARRSVKKNKQKKIAEQTAKEEIKAVEAEELQSKPIENDEQSKITNISKTEDTKSMNEFNDIIVNTKTLSNSNSMMAAVAESPESSVTDILSGDMIIDLDKVAPALTSIYTIIKNEKGKDDALKLIIEDIIQTANIDPKIMKYTFAAAVQALGAENKAELVSSLRDKLKEGRLLKESVSDVTKKTPTNQTEKKTSGGIDASSATADNNFMVEEVSIQVIKKLEEKIGMPIDQVIEYVKQNQSAMLGTAVASTKKPPGKVTPDEADEALSNVVKTTKAMLEEEAKSKEDSSKKEIKDKYPSDIEPSESKTQDTPKVIESVEPIVKEDSSNNNKRIRGPLKPKSKEELSTQTDYDEPDIDYSILEDVRVWKLPNIVTVYFASIGVADILGLPVINGTVGIPIMIIAVPCMYFVYGSMCYKEYTTAERGAGISLNKLPLLSRIKSKPFLIFGGSLAVSMISGFIGVIKFTALFQIWVVASVVAIALYFMTHFACKDAIFDPSSLSKEQAANIKYRNDKERDEKKKANQASRQERQADRRAQVVNDAIRTKRR